MEKPEVCGADTRASDIIAYIDARDSFDLELRIEKGGNKIGIAFSSLRYLSLGKEKRVRLKGRNVMFHR